VLEYLKRDVANLALGNKDNHARNTAVQRDFESHVALTPLYDFAPMYLHPDGIARCIRWEANDGGQPDWARVLDKVCADSMPRPGEARAPLQRAPLRAGLRALAPVLDEIAGDAAGSGLEPEVHAHLRPGMRAQARQLAALA